MRKYKTIGIISFIVGAVYLARAFTLLKAPGDLPMTNAYLIVIGVLLCASASGVYICGASSGASVLQNGPERRHDFLILSLICFIVFALLFERIGTIKVSFILSFMLSAIWNRNKSASKDAVRKFIFMEYFAANRIHIAGNILTSGLCALGIWLIYFWIFNISLP